MEIRNKQNAREDVFNLRSRVVFETSNHCLPRAVHVQSFVMKLLPQSINPHGAEVVRIRFSIGFFLSSVHSDEEIFYHVTWYIFEGRLFGNLGAILDEEIQRCLFE